MSEWKTILFALLLHPAQPIVFVQTVTGRAVLPRVAHPDRIWASDTHTLTPLFSKLVGVPVNILRWVAYQRDEAAQITYRIHLLEPRDQAELPQGLWLPLVSIMDVGDMPAALRAGLRDWQDEQLSGLIPDRRAPWATPGWQANAERWIAVQVEQLGRGAILSLEPIKSWSISFVLRVNTESGVLYFKATRDLPLWVNEGLFQTRLAEIYPGQIPAPVAVNHSTGWMLLDDFGQPLGPEAQLEFQTRMLQDFARLQIDSSNRIEALLAASCKDRRLNFLFDQLAALISNDQTLALIDPEQRTPLITRFKKALPRFKILIDQLDALPVPAALMHGDLHAGNVVLHDERIVFFDWTDAAISHPFIDMIHIFQEENPEKHTLLREAYLSVWEAVFPRDSVRRAWALAQVLFGLYHAVSYQAILLGIEPAYRIELDAASFYIQFALDQLEKYEREESGWN